MARVLRMHNEAMHPKPVKDINQLISSIVTWEDKWSRMAKERTIDLPQLWKIAAFIELCPTEVQDMIYQTIDEVQENYEKVKQRVVSWSANSERSDPDGHWRGRGLSRRGVRH